MYSVWLRKIFVGLLKFLQTKEGQRHFWGAPILHKIWIISCPLLYFNFKSFMDPNFSWIIIFQGIVHDSGVLLSEFWNIYKLKREDLLSGGNQFHRKSELFGASFCITVFKVFYTKILRHSLDFNAFCMIRKYFSQSHQIPTN